MKTLNLMIFYGITIALICFDVSLGRSLAGAGGAEALIDGMAFLGRSGPRGGQFDGDDELIFRNGRFTSTACTPWQFDSPIYTATQESDGIHFHAVTSSPRYGKIDWKGVVRDELIEVSYLWTMHRWYWFDVHEERWFRGSIKRD
jgi:hypothetical protein